MHDRPPHHRLGAASTPTPTASAGSVSAAAGPAHRRDRCAQSRPGVDRRDACSRSWDEDAGAGPVSSEPARPATLGRSHADDAERRRSSTWSRRLQRSARRPSAPPIATRSRAGPDRAVTGRPAECGVLLRGPARASPGELPASTPSSAARLARRPTARERPAQAATGNADLRDWASGPSSWPASRATGSARSAESRETQRSAAPPGAAARQQPALDGRPGRRRASARSPPRWSLDDPFADAARGRGSTYRRSSCSRSSIPATTVPARIHGPPDRRQRPAARAGCGRTGSTTCASSR